MAETARDDDALALAKFLRPLAWEVHQQPSVDNVEELVLIAMLVPRVDTMDDAEANDAIVDSAEALVVPGAVIGPHQIIDVERLERRVLDVEKRAPRIRRIDFANWSRRSFRTKR
jgi:hypothetical protein